MVALLIGGEARSQEGAPPADATPPTAPAPDPADAEPYGPPLFAETAPLLPELWRLVEARDAGPRAIAAGLAVLDDFLAHPKDADALAQATAEWLRARLLTRRGRGAEARSAWEALAMTPGAFSDEARSALAELDAKGRAHWLLTRTPGAPDFLAGARRGVKELVKRHEGQRAAELLAAALELGMGESMRLELVLMRAELLPRDEAVALLLDVWWLDEDPTPDARITRALKKLKALPDEDAVAFRAALLAPRGASEASEPKPRRGRAVKVKRPTGAVAELAQALADRWDDTTCAARLAAFPAVPSLADTPYPGFSRALLLRKVDRDAEAVSELLGVIERFPEHALADSARAQASVLLRGLDRAAEADPLDEALLVSAPPGELQRDALWRLGFGAVLRGDGKVAERYLRALEQRYGGEPDRHSFSWFERARYWRGRAALVAGDREAAREHWEAVVRRFPAGWYALLARDRLGLEPRRARPGRADRGARDDHAWDLTRDDGMATALALYRLGAEEAARDAFEALLDARQLPGNGRKLLADLWDLEGKHDRADRVLRYAAIPPTMPGDGGDEDVYLAWYPFAHGESVSEAARDNRLPPQLLAGIVSVETRFQEKGRSRVGAIGLAQLMPTTGQAVGKKIFGDSFKASQLWDPATNLAVAAKYLGSLLDRFDGHPALAVLAYNAGPAPVRRWLAERGRLELDAFVETIPFEQARRYVMRVCSDAEIYRRLYALEREPLTLPRAMPRAPASARGEP